MTMGKLTQLKGADLLRDLDVREVDSGIDELGETLSACAHLLTYHAEHMNNSPNNTLPFGIAAVLRHEAVRLARLRVKLAYGYDVKA